VTTVIEIGPPDPPRPDAIGAVTTGSLWLSRTGNTILVTTALTDRIYNAAFWPDRPGQDRIPGPDAAATMVNAEQIAASCRHLACPLPALVELLEQVSADAHAKARAVYEQRRLPDVLGAAVDAEPAGARRRYARALADATIAGEREHGVDLPCDELDVNARASVRLHVDAAWDQLRYEGLTVGDRVRVRCWPDGLVRDGSVEQITYGASAPVTIRVHYPPGWRDADGIEPINPANYSSGRIVRR
jgi:hypothetical protein